jgi:hypothetical protein
MEDTDQRPELTYAALAATMELSRLRSQILVGLALATKFPSDDEWWELVSTPDYIESINSLSEVIHDISSDPAVLEQVTPESVAEASDKHYGRARECIEALCDHIEVSPDDLLNVLVST